MSNKANIHKNLLFCLSISYILYNIQLFYHYYQFTYRVKLEYSVGRLAKAIFYEEQLKTSISTFLIVAILIIAFRMVKYFKVKATQ